MSGPSPSRRAAQAIDALRHGWPISFDGGPVLLPVETAPVGRTMAGQLLISSARAATLKLANQRAAAIPAAIPHAPILVTGGEPFNLPDAMAIADPALDLNNPLKGPFKVEPIEWEEIAIVAMEMARIAGILPAFMVNPNSASPDNASPDSAFEAHSLNASDFSEIGAKSDMQIATRAKLPVSACPNAQIIAFRSTWDTREHVALIIGEQCGDAPPLVRVHSECLTGDILGSLKCDCGPQLDGALHAMAGHSNDHGGWGVLLYLRQEGRGIGLINKLRAYQLQDQGFDTVDANERLGLPDEARDFPIAARMLELIGATSVRLLTNNPAKVDALTQAGIQVLERVQHQLPENPHNAQYLATKRDRSGHLLK